MNVDRVINRAVYFDVEFCTWPILNFSGYSALATLRTVPMFLTPGVASLKLTVTKRWCFTASIPANAALLSSHCRF